MTRQQEAGAGSVAPIGVFDSGIGGLTILKALRDRLPRENLVYFGDLGRSPYGTKSTETVRRYAGQITRFLLTLGVKLIVIACNTASAAAGDLVSQLAHPVPVLEVVGHGSRMALDLASRLAEDEVRIGVLGTRTTVSSGVYQDRLLALAAEQGLQPPLIRQQACPLFVPLAEEGLWQGEIPDQIARLYLEELKAFSPQVVILGCTHYPVLFDTISKALPPGTVLNDSAPAVARSAEGLLTDSGRLAPRDQEGTVTFYCSDSEDTFRHQAARFLDMPVDIVHHIDLDTWEG